MANMELGSVNLLVQIGLVPVVLLGIQLLEWAFHKYALHGLGKNPKSFWSFHWKDHHGNARRNQMIDADYGTSVFKWNAQSKELLALAGGVFVVSPLVFFAPIVFLAFLTGALRYYVVHRLSHTRLGWAKTNLSWHYDHHFGKNQDANWCVTGEWPDRLFGTRIRF